MEELNRKKWDRMEIVGLILVIVSLLALIFVPDSLSNLFNSITAQVFPIVVDVFLTSDVGIAIVVSVIVGRILERFGFTDALIRVFLPIMRMININPSVVIPSIYNILGDINASGKVAGPVLVKSNATKAEQKIAVATMIQNPQSFATFVLGIIALSVFKINSLPLVILSIFLPLVLVPFILSKTIYRDTKSVQIEELPRFTPNTPIMKVLFDSGIEGMHLLLLVIIPAVAVVFSLIGILDFAGVWNPIQLYMGKILNFLGVESSSGIVTLLVSPTLAMAQVSDLIGQIDPKLVVGGFVLANSGLPISVILGQVPATWAEVTDLSQKEAMLAAILGCFIRLLTATILAYLLTPFIIG